MNQTKYSGWLLDVYANPHKGATVWLLCEDGHRYRFTQDFPVTFYLGGNQKELGKLKDFLQKQRVAVRVWHTRQTHLFRGEIDVVAIRVQNGAQQPALYHRLQNLFPRFEYYNADIALPIRYHVATSTFPLAFCTLTADDEKNITQISSNDSRWDLAPLLPPLRIMKVFPLGNPDKALPRAIRVSFGNIAESISTKNHKHLMLRFSELIELFDPDIISTIFGDKWLFPYLFSISELTRVPFNPNRDKTRAPIRVKPNQFSSYGHLVHRDQQTLLLGRLHIDQENSMALDQNAARLSSRTGSNKFTDEAIGSALPGILEMARTSNLPIQNAARRSTGGAFVGMQVTASLQKGILVPNRKQERERFKTGSQLVTADNGGLIFKPIVGLHENVAEIDFFSMYPTIMSKWNISAETVGAKSSDSRRAPGINVPIDQTSRGIVAGILEPVLNKRRIAKDEIKSGENKYSAARFLKASSDFLKGLGWVSYGYQGFLGNRIGSIEAHEAINAISRDVIADAKEAAEEFGYSVLHIYVDSLFVKANEDSKSLVELAAEIERRTDLTIDIEGVLRWIAFLPSKQNQAVPVPNCFFGVFESGEIKCRGIMARRGDTPSYIHDIQLEAIQIMASEPRFDKMPALVPVLVEFFRNSFQQIARGEVITEKLVVSQTLSRDVQDFKVKSPAAVAANQLIKAGKPIGAGQNIDFLHIKDNPFVIAWNLVEKDSPPKLDVEWYCDQLLRAADEVLCSFGIPKATLQEWLRGSPTYAVPQDYVRTAPAELPMLREIDDRVRNRKYVWLR